ncbi:MAG: hypothetical protein ACOY3Y_11430 [Acidobacteriota bacterium]
MNQWCEVVVEGPHDAVRGFVSGFEFARDQREQVVFGRDLPIAPASLQEKLARLLAGGSHTLLFGPRAVALELARGLREWGAPAGLSVTHVREIRRASFRFDGETFNPEVAGRIHAAMVTSLPEAVAIADLHEHEETSPGAAGTELYAPDHAFRYRVTGVCSGPLAGILEMHRRATDLQFVEAEGIGIESSEVECP